MENDWVKVYGFTEGYLAEIARQYLSDHEILSVVMNKKDPNYLSFGEVEIYVKKEDCIRARNLLKKMEN